MGQQDAYALGRSNLNGFLFADIGIERSGMPLSVISALARQGFDPWQEAGRLARLPRTVAADGLARLIAAMPSSLWLMPDATVIAARLVALLPGQDDASAFKEIDVRLGSPWLIAAVVVMAALAGLATFADSGPVSEKVAAVPTVSAPVHPVPTGD